MQSRLSRLLPASVPRYVRCYDSGEAFTDRYTAVFIGRAAKMRGHGSQPDQWPYLAMSARPFHPQGFGQHGHSNGQPCDVRPGSWGGPAIGQKGHLGRRIAFTDLPADCQKAVLQDYREIWNLNS